MAIAKPAVTGLSAPIWRRKKGSCTGHHEKGHAPGDGQCVGEGEEQAGNRIGVRTGSIATTRIRVFAIARCRALGLSWLTRRFVEVARHQRQKRKGHDEDHEGRPPVNRCDQPAEHVDENGHVVDDGAAQSEEALAFPSCEVVPDQRRCRRQNAGHGDPDDGAAGQQRRQGVERRARGTGHAVKHDRTEQKAFASETVNQEPGGGGQERDEDRRHRKDETRQVIDVGDVRKMSADGGKRGRQGRKGHHRQRHDEEECRFDREPRRGALARVRTCHGDA